MSKDFNAALKHRRSIYGISKETVVSDDRIREVVAEAIQHTPSSFNSQSSRAVILLGEQHDKLWNITKETLRNLINDEEQFKSTAERMAAFSNGYGTVLFFEDQSVIDGLQAQFPSYADNFPIWSNQSAGMLQFVVWTSLELEGFGASLQHYNPLIDDQVKSEWAIPAEWKLLAQLPFGKPTVEPGEKQFAPIETKLKVFK